MMMMMMMMMILPMIGPNMGLHGFLGEEGSKDSGVVDDDIFWLIRWLLLWKLWR